ncbi:hypothetical protein [Microbacterium oleivorans]|uniref:Uncharacterized protein n=1 Tax=Microbacterium oleivorans TaxID=273677 RepID=A0A7D5JCY5_9MICO|nr:hypothetical protein [Microbacterium oleivorans]QLD11380.1 hypothetical protein HW566_06080 [Microbacterium oleivorans]
MNFESPQDPPQVEESLAPIAYELAVIRERIVNEVGAMRPSPKKIEAALNGMQEVLQAVVVAIYKLETGDRPLLQSEKRAFRLDDGEPPLRD